MTTVNGQLGHVRKYESKPLDQNEVRVHATHHTQMRESIVRFKKTLTAVATASLLALPAAAMADSHGAQVTVVHGIPGTTVDVWANGEPLLPGFTPGTVTDPVSLPAGDYSLEIYAAGADPEATDPILATADPVAVTDGLNASIVAHLNADGAPTLTVFVNDTSEVAAGEARLTVRHTAAAPNVDILAGGDVIFPDVPNANGDGSVEGVIDVPAGDYDVAVNVAGTEDEVISVAGFGLAEGANTIVYAIGDPAAEDGSTFDLLVQSITGLHSNPDGVPAGTAGLATDNGAAALTAAGLLVLAGAALGLRRRATESV